ncbi:MAG: cysteine desulfurase [Hyphomonadaceae bacterium]|nr:MAG: cysteine desulfurase [Hyphomonadaceae bacterium]
MKHRIYLDHNATSKLRPFVKAAMMEAMDNCGNPSSIHMDGQTARKLVENARKAIISSLGTYSAEVVFTSGATEAAQLALESAKAMGLNLAFIGAGEHPAIMAYAKQLFENLVVIPIDGNGNIDCRWLEARLAQAQNAGQKAFVAVQAANNEIGIINPLSKISGIVKNHGAALMVDAVQAFGKIPPDDYAGYADWLIISPHKIGGPLGVGALLLAPGIEGARNRPGGGQEKGLRSGTPNIPAIRGFGVASALAGDVAEFAATTCALRDKFEQEIMTQWPDAIIFGHAASRLPNTSCFAIPNWSAEHMVIALDLAGVSISSGSACSSGSVKASATLLVLKAPEQLAKCAVRVSFGWNNEAADLGKIIAAMQNADMRRRNAAA